MMNVENDSTEAVNDLELALSYSNSCIPTRSRDSGAGVNAASRVDMTFVTSDALSELVWSPHNGLTLKSAACSFAEKKPYLFSDLGPSNMVLSPPQSIASRGTTSDKPIDEGNLIASPMAFHVEGEVGEGAGLVRSPGSSADVKPVFGSRHGYDEGASDNMDEMNVIGGPSVVHTNHKETTSTTDGKGLDSPNNIQITSTAKNGENNAGPENQKTKDFLSLRTNEPGAGEAQIDPMSREHNEVMMVNPSGKVEDPASDGHGLGLELAMAFDVHGMKQCKGLDSPTPKLMPLGERQKNLSFVIEDESETKMKMDDSTIVPPHDKVEYTAENDLQLLIGKDASGKIEERIPRVKAVPSEASPTNSRTSLNRRKGKGKILSVNERVAKDEDDSQDTVESCNSTGLFSTGSKRWSFERQLIVGSKRVKKQIQESPDSASLVGQDSSFMNWISNMVKGLNKTSQDVAPSLALTLVHPNQVHASHDQKITTCSRNNDPGSRNMGFQTMFQSLYCSNSREQETKKSKGNSPIRGSKEYVLATKVSGANITPIACHGENDNFSKQCFLSNEKVNQSSYGNEAGPPAKPINSCANIAGAPEMCKSGYYSDQNKTSCNFSCNNENDGRNSSSSSLGKRKMDSTERNDSDLPPEGRVSDNVGYRCSPLGSLWINRFNPKNPCPTLSLDYCNQSVSNAIDCPTDCTMLIPAVDKTSSAAKECSTEDLVNIASKELHTAKEYPTDLVNVVGKEVQNYAPNTESSFGFKRIHGHNDQKPAYKLNPIQPSPKFKNSEAIASVFARRLDALKHIIVPLNAKDDAAHMMTTCFYCGKSGHDLLDCSEITETERENLLRNISSYDGAEESPCVCIRCFQLDHWAISCPIASSTGQDQSEQGASLGNHFSASMMQLIMGNKKCARILETRQRHNQAVDVGTSCDGKNSRVDVDKHIPSSYVDNVLKAKQSTPLCNLINEKFSNVPEGMFDAIRKLRLSRLDTLKWMNSHNSLLHLDGFFLRLRLGKWEEGLGGTGYYVAYITGEQREKPPQGSKRPISVKIGGIRCLVESQYISNKDFLEDELKAWWCATMESGGKIPSEDQLRLKIEERRRLGI